MRIIHRILDEELVPGISLALVDVNGPVWVEGFGVSSLDSEEAVNMHSVFRAGSLSKPITAMAVMQLHQRELIDIEQPISDYVESFSVNRYSKQARPITVRQLMTHHSGLPSDLMKGMFTETPFTQVTVELRDGYLAFPPGTRFKYSNLGYDLLGLAIEAQTQTSFETYMQSNLLQPMGMTDSGFSLSTQMATRLASGHKDGTTRAAPALRDKPALGFYTTARDMGKLLSALIKREMPGLSAGNLEEMWRIESHPLDANPQLQSGMGWFIQYHAKLGRLLRHGGSTLLYGSEIALLPERGLGVVVMANAAESNHMARELALTILMLAAGTEDVADESLRTRGDFYKAQRKEVFASGKYATSLGLMVFESNSNRLCACIIDRILDLTRFDDGSLALTAESANSLPESHRILGELRFSIRRQYGEEMLLAERNGQAEDFGSKIGYSDLNAVWKKRLGSYRTINPDEGYTLTDLWLSEESGVLCLHYHAPHFSNLEVRLPLLPISDDQAVIMGVGRGAGETVDFIEVDGRPCIRFSGYIGMPVAKE